jgi:tetratricopeptide (TPR) repeat protein
MQSDTEFLQQSEEPKRSLSGAVIAVSFLILLGLLVGVVFYLPEAVKDRPVEVPRQEPPPAVVEEREAAPAPVEREQPAYSEEDKEAAEDALAELIHKQEYLEEKAVEEWAAEDYEAAKGRAKEGDGFFREKNYRAAAEEYRASIDILNELAERIEPVVEEALAAGLEALDAGKGEAAKASFELVLKIDPENAAATQGLARAENIEEVFRLIREGREYEEAGELRQARSVYRQARDLDPAVAEAQEALRRLAGKIAADNFLAAMSRGLTALDQGQYDTAIDAFNEAKRMRPGSTEAEEGLAQAEEGKRLATIAGHRNRAESFEPQEKWHEALGEYRAVLTIDSSLAFAQ